MRLIKLSQVKERTSLGRSSIYKFIEEGRFPRQVPLGGRGVAWIEEEVDEWVQARIDERDDELVGQV